MTIFYLFEEFILEILHESLRIRKYTVESDIERVEGKRKEKIKNMVLFRQ